VFRDENWYAETVEKSARHCVGLWRWNAPFIQLEQQKGAWQEIDCILGGLWFDTFFKGYDIPEELWESPQNIEDTEKAISLIIKADEKEYKSMHQLKEVIRPGVLESSREAFEKVFHEELEKILPACTSTIEAFQLVQFGAIYRSFAYQMISYVRKFKPVINIVDNNLYDLFFKIPISVKRNGSLVRIALWQRNKRFALLPNSNSWLPAILPNYCHKTALYARRKMSGVRLKWYQLTKSQEYRSHGSWPQMGRLWSNNLKMRGTIDNMIMNPPVLVERFFDMDSVNKIWEKHKNGYDDYSDILGILVGVGFAGIK
jgi:hypothetical protein